MKYHVRNIKHSAWHEKTYHKNDFPFFFSYISASYINPVKKKVMKRYVVSSYSQRSREGIVGLPLLYVGEGSLALMF